MLLPDSQTGSRLEQTVCVPYTAEQHNGIDIFFQSLLFLKKGCVGATIFFRRSDTHKNFFNFFFVRTQFFIFLMYCFFLALF